MKNIGKFAALTMALALALALVACGNGSQESSSSTEAAESASTSTAADTESTESSTASGTEAGTGDFTLGTINGDTYENESLGIKFTAPAGYTFADADDLVSLNAQVGEIITSEDAKAALEDGSTFIDMYATDANNNNVNITISDISNLGSLSVEDYRDASLDNVVSELEGLGLTVDEHVTGTYTTDSGLELPALRLSSTQADGSPVLQQQAYYTSGNYVMTVTATAFDDSSLDTMLEGFALM